MSDAEVFRQAKALLAKGWTQGFYAKDHADGLPVGTDADNAACFCFIGAVYRANNMVSCVGPDDRNARRYRLVGYARKVLGVHDACGVFAWNDDPLRLHEEVLSLADLCAKAAGG